jgi:hypothetical protein
MLEFLTQEREHKQTELTRKQNDLQVFQAKHGILSTPDGKGSQVKQQLEELSRP